MHTIPRIILEEVISGGCSFSHTSADSLMLGWRFRKTLRCAVLNDWYSCLPSRILDRDGASAVPRDGRNVCRGDCLCIQGGRRQSPRIQSPQDRLKTRMRGLEKPVSKGRGCFQGQIAHCLPSFYWHFWFAIFFGLLRGCALGMQRDNGHGPHTGRSRVRGTIVHLGEDACATRPASEYPDVELL